MRERHEFVEVPGGHLWTATSGTGIPLVLCHGGPGGYDYLGPVADMVGEVALVHRFDQRGGGRSVAGEPWTVAAMVNDLEALRDHWGHEGWFVGGHSWGAHLALFYALTHPSRTVGLVLSNGTGIRWGWSAERRARRMPRLTEQERAEVAQLEHALRRGHNEQARNRLRELMWLANFADRDHAVRSRRFDEYPVDPKIVDAIEADWRHVLDGIETTVAELSIPALVLHGEQDPIGEEGPRELARLLPEGQFITLPAVGHIPWLEDGNELRDHLVAFLTDRQGSRSKPDQTFCQRLQPRLPE